MSAEDFLHLTGRKCLWLVGVNPNEWRSLKPIVERVELVRQFRLASKKLKTKGDASTPSVFAELRQPKTQFLAIPKTSSERRLYIPISFLPATTIVASEVYFAEGATPFDFGILTSAMHMAWVRQVCGRLKSDFRYSNKLVYNNFPWPTDATSAQREAVERAAQDVLDARAAFTGQTLADLYDPLAMPKPLRDAHRALDRTVDRGYRKQPFDSDRQRVEYLFGLYEKLTSLYGTTKSRGRSRTRRTGDSPEGSA